MWRNQRGREFVLVAKNDGFGDEGIVLKRVLDRLGSNKFSTRSFDQIFLSVGDREKAVFIQIPDITGLEPAIHKCILSFIWFVPITLEYRWASYQLRFLAGGGAPQKERSHRSISSELRSPFGQPGREFSRRLAGLQP